MGGKIIVIEGSDASGKKTQAELLLKRLEKEGYKTGYLDFPDYPSETGKKIAAYLRGDLGGIDSLSPYDAAKLYADDRLAKRELLLKMLDEGRIVVVNRYVLSNKCHQSARISGLEEQNKFLNWVDELEYSVNKLPKEDLVIYLDVPVSSAVNLMRTKSKRDYLKGEQDIHESNVGYLKKVEKQYASIISKEKNAVKIDCMKRSNLMSKEEIHNLVWNAVKTVI